MKKLYKSTRAGKIAAYSAMAGAFVAGSDVNAAVVYTDIDDVTYGLGDSYAMDLDDNGVTDFIFVNIINTAGTWSFADVIGSSAAFSYGAPSNMVMGYAGDILPYGSALSSGDPINEDQDFLSNATSSGAANIAWLGSLSNGNSYGPWANTTDKYLGVQFEIDGDVHYGWARLDISVDPISVTVKDYAYNDEVGASINAGEGVTVGIISLNESQVSAYSFGSVINMVIKDATAGLNAVNVFDIDGRLVYSNSITSNNMTIDLNNVSTGLYTVQALGANNAVFTKSLYIQN